LLKVAEINGNSCKRYYVSTSSAVQNREPYSIKKLNSGDAVYVDATAGIWYLDGVGIDLVSGDEVSIASTYAPGGVGQICENFDPSCYFFGGNEIGTGSQECQDIIAQGTITQLKS